MRRTLVVYYSRSGATRALAERIVAALDADVEPLTSRARRGGLLGWLRCAVEAKLRRPAPIAPCVHDPSEYDLVVVGTPIWSGTMSSPVRAYLRQHGGACRSVAFFCTCGGSDAAPTFAAMAEECGAAPVATLRVAAAELARAPAAAAELAVQVEAIA